MDANDLFRDQLTDRRERLSSAVRTSPDPSLFKLLTEVDAALERLDQGSFGLCQVCHEPIEPDRLLANPLVCACLDHLSHAEQDALQRDLELVSLVQRRLLPESSLQIDGWEFGYHYQPFRLASGDYCDVLPAGDRTYFLLGDVSGKGVAASMLVANLHGLFRTLLTSASDLKSSLERANRVFCESTLSSHYATLIAVAAGPAGRLTIANAGHCTPFLLGDGPPQAMESTGLPLGVFCEAQYETHTMDLKAGEALFLYTDGLSETRNPAGQEYGAENLSENLDRIRSLGAEDFLKACLLDLDTFRNKVPLADDLSLAILRRTA